MIASSLGRLHNVKFIIEKIQSSGNSPAASSKMGAGGVDRPQKNSWRPLHLAVVEGQLEVVQYLLEVGAQPEVQLNTSFDKMTPLMLAAAFANLVIFVLFLTCLGLGRRCYRQNVTFHKNCEKAFNLNLSVLAIILVHAHV